MGLEGFHLKDVMLGLVAKMEPFLCGAEALIYQRVEQEVERLVDIGAVLGLLGGEVGHFQIPQGLQTVPRAVGIRLHGGVAQLGPGLDVKKEQEAVHIAQALAGELTFVQFFFSCEHSLFSPFHEVMNRFVPDQLDGLTQGVFQVF